MRVLAIADEEARVLYDFYKPGMLDEFDLIVSCGDLNKNYLEFLVTMARCPLLYVSGNHDEDYENNPPEGCFCIDDQIYVHNGVRFLGLGGSYRYRPNGTYMYTESQMKRRIIKLLPKILWHRGFDVLVTHAPARGHGDLEDMPHRGFECFLSLMDRFQPKYMLHGHVHRNYGVKIPMIRQYEKTTIINAFEYIKLNLEISQNAH